jgi:hypothetical protein
VTAVAAFPDAAVSKPVAVVKVFPDVPTVNVDQPSATVGAAVSKLIVPLPPAPTDIAARAVVRHATVIVIRRRSFFI